MTRALTPEMLDEIQSQIGGLLNEERAIALFAAARMGMSGWRDDMENAPRDGTRIEPEATEWYFWRRSPSQPWFGPVTRDAIPQPGEVESRRLYMLANVQPSPQEPGR